MGFYNFPGVGVVHLQEVKPARVVPGPERHRWDAKPGWGEYTTCTRCGCRKHRAKHDYQEYYQLLGQPWQLERPACTGKPATPKLAQGRLEL